MIPIYSLYTPSHVPLKERFFEPTVPQDMELRMTYFDNPGEGQICDPSFCRGIIRKVEVILQAIEENWHQPFVWSDVDVQFFQPFTDWVDRATADYDLVFQVDAPWPVLCAGFFFCKGGEEVRELFQQTLAFVKQEDSRGDDQKYVREHVWNFPGIKAGYLPLSFCGGGTFSNQIWEPGREFPIPTELIAHHANFTIGVANKIAQCEYVRGLKAKGHSIGMEEAKRYINHPKKLSF